MTVPNVISFNGRTGAVLPQIGDYSLSQITGSIPPQGRLTLASGISVMDASVSGSTTVYYTPYSGLYAPIWNGSTFMINNFGGELSQGISDTTKSPAATVASSVYDMFLWLDGSTYRCTRGPAWTSLTARGTGAGTTQLTLTQGVQVNANAITHGPAAGYGTYVGSIGTNGSNTVDFIWGGSGSSGAQANLMCWNCYNRVDVTANIQDNGASYTYTSNTPRLARSSFGNTCYFLSGLSEDGFSAVYMPSLQTAAAAGANFSVGVGVDTTSGFSAPANMFFINQASFATTVEVPIAGLWGAPTGVHYVAAVEAGDNTNANTFNYYSNNNLTFRFKM